MSRGEIRGEGTLLSVLVELARGGSQAASARRELFRIGEVSCELGEGFSDESWSRIRMWSLERPMLEEYLASAVRNLLASGGDGASLEISDGLVAWVRAREEGIEHTNEALQDLQKLHLLQRAILRSEKVLSAARPWLAPPGARSSRNRGPKSAPALVSRRGERTLAEGMRRTVAWYREAGWL